MAATEAPATDFVETSITDPKTGQVIPKFPSGFPHPIHPATESVIVLLPGDKVTVGGKVCCLKTAVAVTTKEIGLVRLDVPAADGTVAIGPAPAPTPAKT